MEQRLGSRDHSPWPVPFRAAAEWWALAAVLEKVGRVPCQSEDPEAWWPAHKPLDGSRRAIEACYGCAAQRACLDYALAANEPFGIWGGTLPEERRAMRRAAQGRVIVGERWAETRGKPVGVT